VTPGEKIKDLRRKSNLTRKDLSEISGISLVSIKFWELDYRTPTKKNAELLSEIFENFGVKTSADFILDNKDVELKKQKSIQDKSRNKLEYIECNIDLLRDSFLLVLNELGDANKRVTLDKVLNKITQTYIKLLISKKHD
jgi:transcriptional regulator with XRE-family HTH domain